MSTAINTALVEQVRTEIGYAVRTSAAYGYSKGKRGTNHEGRIDALIEGAEAAVLPIIRKAQADALRDAAEKLLDGTWPDGFFPGVAASARELTARATDLDQDHRMVAERTREHEASQEPSEERLEAAAADMWGEDDSQPPWHEARDYWLNMARIAFAANPEEHE